MSFKLNNMNLACDPMYDKNRNNQVIGYLCSSSNIVEHFAPTLIDTNTSANFNQVKQISDNAWHSLGSCVITGSNQNEATSALTLNFTTGNGKKNKIGLERLITGFGVSNSLPFIFHFLDEASQTAYVIRKPTWDINDNTLNLSAFRGKDGIMDSDFISLRNLKTTLELRVGVYDINNGSQRQNIYEKWKGYTLNDTNTSANFNQVKDISNNAWHKFGMGVITSSNQNERTSILVINLTNVNGNDINIGLQKLGVGFEVTDSLPFIFHFYDTTPQNGYVIRKPTWNINGNTLTLTAFRGKDGITDGDFVELRELRTPLELRVGVYDINNGSQRQNISDKWNAAPSTCTIS